MNITINIPELERILQILEDVHRAMNIVFFAPNVTHPHTLEEITMLQLTDIQKTTLRIQPVDAKGNPATLAATPVWTVSDPTILSITPAADGLSADVAAVGPDGASQVNVSADTGTHTIAGQLDVTVVSSEATSLNIVADAPVAQ